ncbi:helix-turn-helix domain-containing protein [Rhodococcus opacus]|uniref:helix-turn-helix domain-containing protein n=1 Tax=Rhodococcus opacus TaxID=37919 RepID=UPI000FFBD8CF
MLVKPESATSRPHLAARETTVARHIQKLRLHRAHRLLVSTEGHHITVAEFGRRCGFSSASHFSRVFRDRFGVTPSEARRGRLRRHAIGVTLTKRLKWLCTNDLKVIAHFLRFLPSRCSAITP